MKLLQKLRLIKIENKVILKDKNIDTKYQNQIFQIKQNVILKILKRIFLIYEIIIMKDLLLILTLNFIRKIKKKNYLTLKLKKVQNFKMNHLEK